MEYGVTAPLVEPGAVSSSSDPRTSMPCLVRMLWLMPLVLPLVLLGGGPAYVLLIGQHQHTATPLEGLGSKSPPANCVGCQPSLVGCAFAESITTEAAVERSLADLLDIFPARVRVTRVLSGCALDGLPPASSLAAAELFVEIFDQEDTDGPLWRTGRELCTTLRPRRGGLGVFDLLSSIVYKHVPFAMPCAEPWELSAAQLDLVERSGAVNGLARAVVRQKGLDPEGEKDTHMSIPLFTLLLVLTLADLGRLGLRRWKARGDTARLVRLAAYAIEEEQVRKASSRIYTDSAGNDQTVTQGGPLHLLEGAESTHFLLRLVFMPSLLVLSLTTFPFFPSTIGLRVACSILFTTTPGPARLRHHRKLLLQVWGISSLVVGPFVLFVLASAHPAICRRITWYGMAWYAMGTCAMAGALCIGAPEAGSKEVQARAWASYDLEDGSAASVSAEATAFSKSMHVFKNAHRTLVALHVGITKYRHTISDDSTLSCGEYLRRVVTSPPFFWLTATLVFGTHVAVLIIFGPRLLSAWKVSSVIVRYGHIEQLFVFASALPFLPTLAWWGLFKMTALLVPMLEVFQRHDVDLWDMNRYDMNQKKDFQTADVKLACRGLESFIDLTVNAELTREALREQLTGVRPAQALPKPGGMSRAQGLSHWKLLSNSHQAAAKFERNELIRGYARAATGMPLTKWFDANWQRLVDGALDAVQDSVDSVADTAKRLAMSAKHQAKMQVEAGEAKAVKSAMFEMMKELLNDMCQREAYNELLVLDYLVTGSVAGEAGPEAGVPGNNMLRWDDERQLLTRRPAGPMDRCIPVDNRKQESVLPIDFFNHAEAQAAGIDICHVLALRLYTSPIGPSVVNEGLRDFDTDTPGGVLVLKNKHPLHTTVVKLDEGIRRLCINNVDRSAPLMRGVSGKFDLGAAAAAGADGQLDASALHTLGRMLGSEDDVLRMARESDATLRTRTLWRGINGINLPKHFLEKGGVCTPPMSTSYSLEEALRYATKAGRVAKDAILFQIEIADAGNPCLGGAPVEFLSVFPDEREELFPPLTLLRPLPPDDGDGEGDEVAYVGGGLLGQRAPICTVHVGDVCLRVVKMYPTAGGSRG